VFGVQGTQIWHWQSKQWRSQPTNLGGVKKFGEGLTAHKISVIEELTYKNKAFIIALQETHRTTADKLVIASFSLAGSVLSRKHGHGTFVHERLELSLVDQSPEQSETEWLCVDIAGYKIINVYKPPRSRWIRARATKAGCLGSIPVGSHRRLVKRFLRSVQPRSR